MLCYLNIILITLCCLATFGQTPLPVGDYPLNGHAGDASYNGNHGTSMGAMLTADRNGVANSAYSFNGTSDYINLGTPDLGATNYTICSWVYPQDISGQRNILHYVHQPSGEEIGMRLNNGRLTMFDGTSEKITSNNTVGTLKWTCVCGVLKTVPSGPDTFRVYINGLPNGESVVDYTPFAAGSFYAIGAHFPGTARVFHGMIDDVVIYGEALSAEQIELLCDFRTLEPCIAYDTVIVLDTNVVTLYDTMVTDIYDTITVSIYDTISVTDTLYIDVPLSSGPTIIQAMRVYPNPTRDRVMIDFDNFVRLNGYTVRIVNVSGITAYSSGVTGPILTVDLNSLAPNGIYFLQLLDPLNQVVVRRTIILQ